MTPHPCCGPELGLRLASRLRNPVHQLWGGVQYHDVHFARVWVRCICMDDANACPCRKKVWVIGDIQSEAGEAASQWRTSCISV